MVVKNFRNYPDNPMVREAMRRIFNKMFEMQNEEDKFFGQIVQGNMHDRLEGIHRLGHRHYYDDSDSGPDEDELQAIAFNDLYKQESSDLEKNEYEWDDFPNLEGDDSDEKVNETKEDRPAMDLWFLGL